MRYKNTMKKKNECFERNERENLQEPKIKLSLSVSNSESQMCTYPFADKALSELHFNYFIFVPFNRLTTTNLIHQGVNLTCMSLVFILAETRIIFAIIFMCNTNSQRLATFARFSNDFAFLQFSVGSFYVVVHTSFHQKKIDSLNKNIYKLFCVRA